VQKSTVKNKSPKVMLKFGPSPNYEEEWLEFVETVLSWPEPKKENSITELKNEKSSERKTQKSQ